MRSNTSFLEALALSILAAATAACTVTTSPGSSGNTSPAPGAPTSPGSTGTSGGATPGTSSGGTKPGSPTSGKQCPTKEEPTTCTAAEQEAYGSCVQNACATTLRQCFGDGYASGAHGGACGDWAACTEACACDDDACVTKCGAPPAACTSCLQGLGTCAASCEEPACMKEPGSGSGSGSGKTCADLEACCAAKADPEEKSTCESALQIAAGNAATCDAIHTSLCQ